MFSHMFLAQTPGEMGQCPVPKTAYMACHFSSCGKGLSNLPEALPKGSILLLDDSMPPNGHDPTVVEKELRKLIEKFSIFAVLMDFQSEKNEKCSAMAKHLASVLPCSVAVTEGYAKELGCSVFLSPTPVNMALKDHIAPWVKQGIYLELALETTQFTVTEDCCASLPVHYTEDLPLADEQLHCHYNVDVLSDKAVFTLGRTGEDLVALAQEAKQLGVLDTVGLFQELVYFNPSI